MTQPEPSTDSRSKRFQPDLDPESRRQPRDGEAWSYKTWARKMLAAGWNRSHRDNSRAAGALSALWFNYPWTYNEDTGRIYNIITNKGSESKPWQAWAAAHTTPPPF